ncbi:MAG TPA: DNA repair protein RecO [Coxiellaceae bacterium]|nr:DNA repair protein RecO [Coxiellaceae bacterium]
MNITKVVLQPAFVLHSRAYRDTSLLVELLTLQYGRLTVVARGVRSMKSRLQGILMPFLPLLVSFSGKTDLRTLQQAEVNGPSYELKGNILLSSFYLNELLMRLLPSHESYPKVYQAYKNTLAGLVDSKQPEIELRLFEKCLLANLGYGLQLDRTIKNEPVLSEEQYIFEFGGGLSRAISNNSSNFSGKSLLALQAGNLSTITELRDAKRLLRGALAELLGDKPLKSRELFKGMV